MTPYTRRFHFSLLAKRSRVDLIIFSPKTLIRFLPQLGRGPSTNGPVAPLAGGGRAQTSVAHSPLFFLRPAGHGASSLPRPSTNFVRFLHLTLFCHHPFLSLLASLVARGVSCSVGLDLASFRTSLNCIPPTQWPPRPLPLPLPLPPLLALARRSLTRMSSRRPSHRPRRRTRLPWTVWYVTL